MVTIRKSNLLGGDLGDRSSTVTVGGTAQIAISQNFARRYMFVMNPSTAVESLWISITNDAEIGHRASIELVPGASFEWAGSTVPTNPLSVTAPDTGHPYNAA